MPSRPPKMSRSETALIIILVLVGALGVFFFRGLSIQEKMWIESENRRINLENIYFNAFGKIRLEGKSAVVYDPITKEFLFSLNPSEDFPMASIVKVMTAITAIEEMPEGTIVTISKEAIDEEGDTGLLFGEKWVLSDLIQFMLTVSSNDAAKAIALASGSDASSFVEAMNKKAADLGLDNTHFSNVTGLDLDLKSPGASSSAEDVAKMLSYAFLKHHDIFAATSKVETILTSESGFVHKLKNTDALLESLSNILASKTGFTELAGGNLAVVFKTTSGRLLSSVVLGSTIDGRFNDMKQLINASSKYANTIMSYANGKNS